jgi:hypothetical protein
MADPGTHVRQGDILAVAVAAVPAETEPMLVQSGARFPLVTGDSDRPGTHLVTATSSVRAFCGDDSLLFAAFSCLARVGAVCRRRWT